MKRVKTIHANVYVYFVIFKGLCGRPDSLKKKIRSFLKEYVALTQD